ncbi:MAG: AMP-binding protein [Actinomycetota bacterium]
MAVGLRERPGAEAEAARDTLPGIFLARCRASANSVALREKRFGVWREHTWAGYERRVRLAGLGLISLGLKTGDRVAIHSEDRPEWVFTELGTICVGGTSVGIYPTNPAAEVGYILSHSDARFVIAEDQEQVDKALAVADSCPALERIIVIDPRGLRGYADARLMTYEHLEELGKQLEASDPALFPRLAAERTADEIGMIVYTSGTTGPPKGAMLSERNLAAAVDITRRIWNATPQDRVLSYLPLCHVGEKIFTVYVPLSSGASANFAESIDTVVANLAEIEPTIFLGVPRIWEKMAAGIIIRMQDASPIKRWMFRRWEKRGRKLAEKWTASGGRYPFPSNIVYLIGWLLVYRSLQRKLGMSKCHSPVSGAAPIAPDILRFFHGIGIHIREGWAQTESAGIGTITPANDVRIGTIGTAVPEVEIRIAEDQEILMRGPTVFAGYFKDPEATRHTVDPDGWLHTGDVGFIDEHAHVHITDRKKDIVITAGGKNVAPSEIENRLKTSPYIREAVVVGDGRKFLAALIGIESDAVSDWATRRSISFTTYRDLTTKPDVVALIEGEVKRVNDDLASVEQIKTFRLIPKELDHEDGELTATQKVKRSVLVDRFKDLVDAMYKGVK